MWRQYFTFTYREIYGYLSVLIFMVLMLLAVKCGRVFERAPEPITVVADSAKTPADLRALDTLHINNANATQLRRFGFRNFEVVNIMRYRDMGGMFTDFSDVCAIYGIDTILLKAKKNLIAYDEFDGVGHRYSQKRLRNNYYSSRKAFDKKGRNNYKYADKNTKSDYRKPTKRVHLYYAEPDSLVKYGVPDFVIDTLLSFRERYIIKGSTTVDSLMQCTSENVADFLRQYVTKAKNKRPAYTEKPKLELNTATIEQLEALKYLGMRTAGTIFNYRSQLGGFYDLSQLHDLNNKYIDEKFDLIIAQLTLDTTKIKRININSHKDLARLKKHPYINSTLFVNRVSRKAGSIDETYFRESLLSLKNVDARIIHYIKFE